MISETMDELLYMIRRGGSCECIKCEFCPLQLIAQDNSRQPKLARCNIKVDNYFGEPVPEELLQAAINMYIREQFPIEYLVDIYL